MTRKPSRTAPTSSAMSVRSLNTNDEEDDLVTTNADGSAMPQQQCQLQFRRNIKLVDPPLTYFRLADEAGKLVARATGGLNPPLRLEFIVPGRRGVVVTCQKDLEDVLRLPTIANEDIVIVQVDADREHPRFQDLESAFTSRNEEEGGEEREALLVPLGDAQPRYQRQPPLSRFHGDDNEDDDDRSTIRGWDEASIVVPSNLVPQPRPPASVTEPLLGHPETMSTQPTREHDFLSPVKLSAPFVSAEHLVAAEYPRRTSNGASSQRPPAPTVTTLNSSAKATNPTSSTTPKRPHSPEASEVKEESGNVKQKKGFPTLLTDPAAVEALTSVIQSDAMRPVMEEISSTIASILVKNAGVVLSSLGRELERNPHLADHFDFSSLVSQSTPSLRREEEEEKRSDGQQVNVGTPNALPSEEEHPYVPMVATPSTTTKSTYPNASSLQTRTSAPPLQQQPQQRVQFERQQPQLRSFQTAPAQLNHHHPTPPPGEAVQYDADDAHEDDPPSLPRQPQAQLVTEGSDIHVDVAQTNPEGVVSWRIQNTGTVAWPRQVELKQMEGELLLPGTIPLPSLGPGDIAQVDFAFRLNEQGESSCSNCDEYQQRDDQN